MKVRHEKEMEMDKLSLSLRTLKVLRMALGKYSRMNETYECVIEVKN